MAHNTVTQEIANRVYEAYIPLPGAALQVDRPWSFEEMAALEMDQPMYYSRQHRIHLMLTTKDTSPSGLKRAAKSARIKAEAEAEDAVRHAWLTARLKASIALEGGE